MAFSGSIKARERPCTRKEKEGRTEGLRGEKRRKTGEKLGKKKRGGRTEKKPSE
jgi:hypothetical protein